jgi:hypothetical protein
LGALILTVLLWPITAIVRRRYGASLALDPASLRAYRFGKIGAILTLAGLGAWTTILGMMLNDYNRLSAKFDSTLHLTQFFGVVAFIGGFALILWNLKAVWTGKRRWPAKVWSIVLALSALTVLWVAFVFNLINFGTNY